MATTQSESMPPIMDRLDLLFRDEGFAHFTLAELTSKLGCSRRALYELAPSKPELFQAVVRYSYSKLLEETKAAMNAQVGPLERLMAFFKVLRERNLGLSPKYLQDVMSIPEINAARLQQVLPILDLLEHNIRDGMVQGVFRKQNPALITSLAFGLLQAVDDPTLRERFDESYASFFDQAMDLFQHGILV